MWVSKMVGLFPWENPRNSWELGPYDWGNLHLPLDMTHEFCHHRASAGPSSRQCPGLKTSVPSDCIFFIQKQTSGFYTLIIYYNMRDISKGINSTKTKDTTKKIKQGKTLSDQRTWWFNQHTTGVQPMRSKSTMDICTVYRQEMLFNQITGYGSAAETNFAHVRTIWLVVWTPLKNISQLGWLFPIYGKIKNVPNHQPAMAAWKKKRSGHSTNTMSPSWAQQSMGALRKIGHQLHQRKWYIEKHETWDAKNTRWLAVWWNKNWFHDALWLI